MIKILKLYDFRFATLPFGTLSSNLRPASEFVASLPIRGKTNFNKLKYRFMHA